jgi:tetratricopeptide (TPR) repeat protein
VRTSLRRCSLSLILFCVSAIVSPIRSGYGQATEYWAFSAGRFEYWAGHYEEAETLLRTALELAEKNTDEYAAALAHCNLGAVYENEERLIEAERSYKKALSIFRHIPDKKYDTAVVLLNLSSLYPVDRRASDALKLLQEALELLKKNTPDERVLTAKILNGFGIVYFQQGKMSRAESLLTQAIRIRFDREPDSEFVGAQILGNLGSVYQRQHKYAKAEESHKRSLEIAEHVLGPVHPYLATILGNLGGLYIESHRYSEAKDQYRRSLSILETMRPVPDRTIVGTLRALSLIYLQEGEKTTAERMLERAVNIARHNRAPDSEMPSLLDAYADILKSLGKMQEALTLQAEARRVRTILALTVRVPN